ncbi:MAG: hypothetical protein R6W75_05655 [Smithellaceae bacterium]
MEPSMNRELVTDPLDREALWSDLRANIELLTACGHSRILAFFGFSWGRHIYPDRWHDMPMSLSEFEKQIVRAEEKGFGRLGSDNVQFTLTDMPLRLSYSYESDIHLSYAREDEIVARIRERWLSEGWLTEMLKSVNYDR